jgi:hypothetical protein
VEPIVGGVIAVQFEVARADGLFTLTVDPDAQVMGLGGGTFTIDGTQVGYTDLLAWLAGRPSSRPVPRAILHPDPELYGTVTKGEFFTV